MCALGAGSGGAVLTVQRAGVTAVGGAVRFATFNAAMFRTRPGLLAADLLAGDDPQACAVAETIQRSRPDVLLLNEFDHDPDGVAAASFAWDYLAVGQRGAPPIEYRYAFTAAVNSGVPTGFDLDGDGTSDGPADAQGYGQFAGQYGMLLLSRHPIETSRVRTFRQFRWKDMPGALLPTDPRSARPVDWFSGAALDVLRLSSRSHWDIPITIGTSRVHLLAAHATPPLFDGPEQRNRMRNHDEIRFWVDYVSAGCGDYIYDDNGGYGGLPSYEPFVIAGDLNADPVDGFRLPGSISGLLDADRVCDPMPGSTGGVLAALRQFAGGRTHTGNPFHHTSDFGDEIFGNMRLDYVLPSTELRPLRHSVFWPPPATGLSHLNGFSDHHLVWVDILPGLPAPVSCRSDRAELDSR